MGLRPTPRPLKMRLFSRTLFENAHFHSRGQGEVSDRLKLHKSLGAEGQSPSPYHLPYT